MEVLTLAVRLAVFDLDGTLLAGSKTVMPVLAAMLWQARHKRAVGAWCYTVAGLVMVMRKLRLIGPERFYMWMTLQVVRWMAVSDPVVLDRVLDETARRLLLEARLDVVAEVQARRAEGCRTVIVSAVIQPLLERIAHTLQCDAVGTRLATRSDGRLTGRFAGPYCSGQGKATALREWADKLGDPVDWAGSFAYADTMPDLPVLETVGNAIAVAPESALRLEAQQRGWRVMEG
jgi:HAD superfamily hydrolase (TIGR01490 family)